MNAQPPRIPRFAPRAKAAQLKQQQNRLLLLVRQRKPMLRRAALFSLGLHLGLAALFVLANLQWQGKMETLPPPAEVEMVWRGGAPETPGQEAPDQPPDAFRPPGDEALPVPPPASAPPPPAPPPPVQQAAPPPPPPAAQAELPPPPPPAPPQPQQRPRPPEAPRPPAPPAPQFPNMPFLPGPPQLGQPGPQLPSGRPGERSRQDQAGIPGRGRLDASPNSDLQTSRNLGPDWRNLFRRWVDDHKRYPRDAIMMNHQGPVTVRITVAPDGLVRSVQLIGPNASPYLNSSLVHMFQGAHLPPLPPGADAGGEVITFTMRYILY